MQNKGLWGCKSCRLPALLSTMMLSMMMLSIIMLFMGACSPSQVTLTPAQKISPIVASLSASTQETQPLTAAAAPTRSATPTTAPSAAPSSTPKRLTPTPAFNLCSPLEDITLAELAQPDLLKNPFQLPRPGMDDGHFGADFAYWSRGTHKQMLGLSVHSSMQGRVAGVIQNRMPYGNAVIIETQLSAAPASWQTAVPAPAPTVQPASNLYCPTDRTNYPSGTARSLYLLYAHLEKSPTVILGQSVSCGQPIGEVGTTGRSVNPHLHLETRVGPSGVTFAEMAHYDNAATESEMSTYCTWRVSGLFQAFDPLEILSLQP